MKKDTAFDIFLSFLFFMGNLGFILLMLTVLNLEYKLHLTISLFLAIFYTRMRLDKEDLQNKIFELKELIEKNK